MPLFDMPPDALDKVYAQSVFELAEAQGGRERLEELAAEFDEVVELTRQDATFSEFLASQVVTGDDRSRSLRAIFDGRVSDLMLRFLLVVNHKGRMSRLLSIVDAYQSMLQDKFGRVEVNVFTRHPIPQEQVEQIKQRLEQSLGREAIIYPYVDQAMIGGIKMQIGDRLFDDSFGTMLRNMRELFKTEGAALIRNRAQNAIEREPGDN